MSRRILMVGIAMAAGLIAGCSDSDGAKRVLEGEGYTEVVPTGHSFFGCDDDAVYSTGFHALDTKGRPVTGAVCRGWFHGSIVRVN